MSTAIEAIEHKFEELGKMIARFKAMKSAFPLTIDAPELNEGEHWAGTFIKPDGTGHHIILLPGDKDAGNWQGAIDWAKEQGGDLPSRDEQAIMFAHSKDQFQEKWYWSNTTLTSDSEWAWSQTFGNGGQGNDRKSSSLCRARAVRRLSLI